MGNLVLPLREGPLDVVGDIHGEHEALLQLLERLGYDPQGHHPSGRRLVFVGDLCDRGQDSPGVIQRVQHMVEAGIADAILGNHEMNLLRGEHGHGNHWFFGMARHPTHAEYGECRAIDESQQAPILKFIRALPVALERADLRIVHAAWSDWAVDACRRLDMPADAAYAHFERQLQSDPRCQELKVRHDVALSRLGDGLRDPAHQPDYSDIGPYDAYVQNGNPIRVSTSGLERVVPAPRFVAERWRFTQRVAWWREYTGHVPVLFGHYWRWWNPAAQAQLSMGIAPLFADDPVGPFMAQDHTAFCIDFSAGARFKQRHLGHDAPYHSRLCAMRWPERELVFDADEPAPLPALRPA
jgi:hypothetical protein